MNKPTTFNSLGEAISAASYVEQLFGAELQWIHNRLSWLFISQSFCLTAYAILSTSTGTRFAGRHTLPILALALPVFGTICCVVVGVAVFAATRVARRLANERRRLVRYINENSPATIPLGGAAGEARHDDWTYWCGELPHRVLPWILGILWVLLIIW